MKKAGITVIAVLLGVLVAIVLIISTVSKVQSVDKGSTQTTEQEKRTTESTTVKTTEQIITEQSTSESTTEINTTELVSTEDAKVEDVLMQTIDINSLDYSKESIEGEVIVQKKYTYLIQKQVVYCVELKLTEDTNIKDNVLYFVSYKSYNSLSLGDICILSYKPMINGVISVDNLKKK